MDTLSPDFAAPAAATDIDGLPVDAATMFADHKGAHKPRIEKRQRRLTKKLVFLKEHLEPDEKILLVTTAVSPTPFLEQLTTGFIFVYIKRCLLVMTNKRLLHIPSTMNYSYRNSIAQARYGDIEKIWMRGASVKIKFKTGAKDQMLYIRRAERKKLKLLLPDISLSGTNTQLGKRVHICPRCSTELEVGNYWCGNCKLEFKSWSTARTLSILLPGGGYFYTGHWFLGISDAVVEIVFMLAILAALTGGSEGAIGAAIAIGLFLVVEKLITVYHAHHFVREYLPKDRRISPVGAFA